MFWKEHAWMIYSLNTLVIIFNIFCDFFLYQILDDRSSGNPTEVKVPTCRH